MLGEECLFVIREQKQFINPTPLEQLLRQSQQLDLLQVALLLLGTAFSMSLLLFSGQEVRFPKHSALGNIGFIFGMPVDILAVFHQI